jgi:protein TonB
MNVWAERYGTPAIVALLIHGLAAASMASVEDDTVLLLSDVLPETDIVLVDIDVASESLPPTEPPPEPPPLPEPEPEPEAAEPPLAATEPPPSEPPPSEPPPEPPSEPPPVTDEPPAPGWADSDDAPGMAFQLGETGPAATATVAVVQGKGNRPSRVGAGSNTGGGGDPDSNGTARPVAKPVSIASIKRGARPIGDTDLIQARDYPEEAKRLGIEGNVKIKLVVDQAGNVTSRSLVTKLGHGFDALALRYAKRLRFEPAVDTNDRPVASVVVWTFRFVLPD